MDENKKIKIDFIGLGAAKSGTTWISKCLEEHPQVCFSKPKETVFFNREVIIFREPNIFTNKNKCFSEYRTKGITEYAKYFKHCNKKNIKGEWSVEYLNDPLTASEIKGEFPDVKLLICLRNPIERAYSHFHYFQHIHKFETSSMSFEEALVKHPIPYIYKSLYYSRLKPYFELFPRENILILIYEDIKENPKRFIRNIYKFLEIDEFFIPSSLDKKINNVTALKYPHLIKVYPTISNLLRKIKLGFLIRIFKKTRLKKIIKLTESKKTLERSPIKHETREYLQSKFKEDIENLEKLVGRNLDIWK